MPSGSRQRLCFAFNALTIKELVQGPVPYSPGFNPPNNSSLVDSLKKSSLVFPTTGSLLVQLPDSPHHVCGDLVRKRPAVFLCHGKFGSQPHALAGFGGEFEEFCHSESLLEVKFVSKRELAPHIDAILEKFPHGLPVMDTPECGIVTKFYFT